MLPHIEDTYGSVHSDCKDFAVVAVVAYLSAFLEVADLQLPGGRLGHDGDEAAREQPLDDVDVLGG